MSEPRTIVLTGCTRGLGRALVSRFTARGHTVIGCGRSESHVANLGREFGEPHHFTALDVADSAAIEAWAADTLEKTGTPDLIINNAAIMNHPAPLWDVSAEEFGRLMDINVDGTLNVIRAFCPAMIAAGRGVIANLSSGWGQSTSPDVGPYCASKFAIEGLTGSLAQDLPRPLVAVAVSPGVVDTDMLRRCWADGAGGYQGPEAWGDGAADFFLALGPKDNGKSVRIG